ncbi:MAG: hypothetical protein ACYC5S_11325, partial [Thiobacillus sp.]
MRGIVGERHRIGADRERGRVAAVGSRAADEQALRAQCIELAGIEHHRIRVEPGDGAAGHRQFQRADIDLPAAAARRRGEIVNRVELQRIRPTARRIDRQQAGVLRAVPAVGEKLRSAHEGEFGTRPHLVVRQHLHALPVRVFRRAGARIGDIARGDAHAVLAAVSLTRHHAPDACVELDRVGAGQQRIVRGQQGIDAVRQPIHTGKVDRLARRAIEFFLRIGRREAAPETRQDGVGVPGGKNIARAAGADGEFVGLEITAAGQ